MGQTVKIRTYVKSDTETYLIDTIEHEGGLWLVPKWLESPYPHMQKPMRIIRMDSLAHKDLGHDFLGTGYRVLALDDPIPKSVLDGKDQSQSGRRFETVEAPELMIRR